MNLNYGLTNESFKLKYDADVSFETKEIRLVSARRDWVAFQLLLKGSEEFVVTVGDCLALSPRGLLNVVRPRCVVENLPETDIKMHLVGMIEDDDRIPKADLLLNDEYVHVEKNVVQSVWIEISIPHDAKAGSYKGSVSLFIRAGLEDERLLDVLDFSLEVKDVTLPDPANYKFHLNLWQHASNIARKHEVHLWSDEHFKVLEEYLKSLAGLGQKAITIVASEIPWAGQLCYRFRSYLSDLFEYNMIKVVREADGEFRYDFSVVERYIGLCFKYGIDKEIEIIGLTGVWADESAGYGKLAEDYPEGIKVRYYDKTDGRFKFFRTGEEIKKYIKALESFFIEKGLIDKVVVAADEPGDAEKYEKILDTVSEVAPSFKFGTAINHVEFIEQFKDRINVFVPYLGCVCDKWDVLENLIGKIDGKMLWYVCCGPAYPNTFVGSPLVESRLIGILTAFMKMDGFLRWNYTVWPERPRERISYRYPGWPAGDTNFVYPGKDGRPILTLRYKNLRRGIEDYELVQMLRERHPDAEKVLEDLWKLVLKSTNIKDFNPEGVKKREELYSLDHNDYDMFKEKLLDVLEKLQS